MLSFFKAGTLKFSVVWWARYVGLPFPLTLSKCFAFNIYLDVCANLFKTMNSGEFSFCAT